MLQQEVRRKTKAFGLLAILLAASFSALIYFGYIPGAYLKTFSSYQELDTFVENNTPRGYRFYSGFQGPLDQQFSAVLNPSPTWAKGMPVPTPTPPTVPAPMPASVPDGLLGTFGTAFGTVASGPSYSKTNVQVVGVDEADVVKTDGYYLYLLSVSKNTVFLIDADPQNAKVVSEISFDKNISLAGLYLSPDSSKLAVLGSEYLIRTETTGFYFGEFGPHTVTREYFNPQDTRSFIKVYDIAEKANPVLSRDLAVSGSYFNSRMIGNYVYVIISEPVQVVDEAVSLPTFYEDEESVKTEPSSIHYVEREDSYYNYYTFTSIVALNILDDAQEVGNLTIMMGGASNIYASPNNFYLTFPGVSTYSLWTGPSEPTTEVHKISINDNTVGFSAKATVPGNVLNQYSMDEFDGYFRIATTSRREGVLQNNVYVLDSGLKMVGALENLAPGETLHSARFMGEKCYLVTFKKTDPLFVISLSPPNQPSVLGELKIPGYSDYLHPYDETHLIGVGIETVEADEGNFAWFQGLKLSLFDVSDVNNPVQMDRIVIGDRGTDSEVLTNPKAFLFDPTLNLLVIPVNLALINTNLYPEPQPNFYGSPVWQGAYIFKISLSGGFEVRGNVTHVDSLAPSNEDSPWTNTSRWINRALYIDRTLYTVSDEMVKLNNLEDLANVAEIFLK